MQLPEGVKGYECKHAFYTASHDGSKDDLVLVKRNVHHSDGTTTPELKHVYNFEREFFIVNEPHRTYEEKKAFEDANKCRRYTCRQTELVEKIARALNRQPNGLRQSILFRSPYVYGADITTTAIIKKGYMDKFEDCLSEASVGVMDIETDVVNGDGTEIISASFTYRDNIYLAYTEKFAGSAQKLEERLQEAYAKYIGGIADDLQASIDSGELSKKRKMLLETCAAELKRRAKLKIHTKLVSSPAEVVKFVFDAAHETKPDFVAFWNISFDIPKMLMGLEVAEIEPKHVFNDPSVPEKFRNFKWRQGSAIKTTATGKTMSKHPAELWHVVDAASSFYLVDAMCVFKQVRVTEGNRNSYSLDAILKDELDLGKLRFAEADHLHGLDWHIFMQQNFKVEYLIYNIFDCMSVELLDNKTKDLALTVPTLCGHSDYSKFPSTPRRLCDDMHFYLKQYGKVISATSDDMTEEFDKHVVNMNGWIVTLPSHLVDDNGLQIIEEAPNLRTMIRAHIADLDVASSYPNTESFMNISMATTVRELAGVGNIPEHTKRMAGLNLTAARTNAVECSSTFFGFPSMDSLLTRYRQKQEEQKETEF